MVFVFKFCGILLLYVCLISSVLSETDTNIKVITVATEQTDGFQRYNWSAKHYEIPFDVLGMGTEWLGGDMNSLGGGHKINLLRAAIEPLKNDKKQLILFTDSYDVIFISTLETIEMKWKQFNANIVFSAEPFCWPDKSLENSYPSVADGEARFLNSGMFMGYASDLYEILKNPAKDTDDDQLYYTKIYLNEELRKKHNIKLDHKSEIFQNLAGAVTNIKLDYDYLSGDAFLLNLVTQSTPSLVHGNGPTKIPLNGLGNYLAGSFSNGYCSHCHENQIELKNDYPMVTMAVFIEKPCPFLEEFFDILLAIDYPKTRLKLFLHNAIEYHSEVVNQFIELFGRKYSSIKTILPTDNIDEANARYLALTYTKEKKCDYMFVIDVDARLDNPQTLKELIKFNRTIIAPMLVRPGEVWSNFWGALNADGYYARSHDYMEIVRNKIRGIWNVPFINSCYLIKSHILSKIAYDTIHLDPELAFAFSLRNENIFMNVVNLDYYGHLVNTEEYDITVKHPDFYMLPTNRPEWQNRYIRSEYWPLLEAKAEFMQPCPDVFWIPMVSDRFCDELIDIMVNYGKWSDGTNYDNRLDNGYESVPTRDIHMKQVGLDALWLMFLRLYVTPIQQSIFIEYNHFPPRSVMNFVVRYMPTEQPYLTPHHDSSTYTINIALNRPGIDYEGGGCRFIRYNCSVIDTKKGWLLMHPGRLTHLHEGLTTTKGTRYIAISFIDP